MGSIYASFIKRIVVYQQLLLGESKNGCFRPFYGILGVLCGMLGVLKSILGVLLSIVGVLSGMLGVFRHHL